MKTTVHLAQQPLRDRYRRHPERAVVVDRARTCGEVPTDPFHSRVRPMADDGVVIPIGTHAALGGPHDAPTPGDLLCAALAACQDSAFRMTANLLGIELVRLEVRVTATADVRGALAMQASVPVGFQAIRCEVDFAVGPGTPAAALERLQAAAERCCVVQQTLRAPPDVRTVFTRDRTTGSGARDGNAPPDGQAHPPALPRRRSS